MKTLKVRWTGIRPLVMHSSRMIDPDNRAVIEINEKLAEIKKQKKNLEKQTELRREVGRLEWEASLYWNDEIGLYLPGENIRATIIEAARKAKFGKQIEQGMLPLDPAEIPIDCGRKTLDLDELYEHAEFSLRHAVRVPPKTGARLMKVRPMIPKWKVEFEVEYDEAILPTVELRNANVLAGRMIGVGSWRPLYGRFAVEFPN